jgi:hypothetical protein
MRLPPRVSDGEEGFHLPFAVCGPAPGSSLSGSASGTCFAHLVPTLGSNGSAGDRSALFASFPATMASLTSHICIMGFDSSSSPYTTILWEGLLSRESHRRPSSRRSTMVGGLNWSQAAVERVLPRGSTGDGSGSEMARAKQTSKRKRRGTRRGRGGKGTCRNWEVSRSTDGHVAPKVRIASPLQGKG